MKRKLAYRLSAVGLVLLLGVFYGCAGREYAPKRGVWYYHKELPAADRAVEAARAAGKDKECPAEFAAAEKMKNDAYNIYWACRTAEGIAKANEATALANGLCPRKAVAPPPPPRRPRRPSGFQRTRPRSIRASAQSSTGRRQAPPAHRSTRGSEAWIRTAPGRYAPAARRNIRSPRWARAAPGRASTTVTVNPPPPPPPASGDSKGAACRSQGDRPACPSCQFRLRQVDRQAGGRCGSSEGDRFRQEVSRQ